jgi:hypothetical protein
VDWQALTRSEGEQVPLRAATPKQYGYQEADLETEFTRDATEPDVSGAKLEAANIRYEAELAAQRTRFEAELAVQIVRAEVQRERGEAQLREAKHRRPGLWGWMHGALAAPVLMIVLVMTAGAAVPL